MNSFKIVLIGDKNTGKTSYVKKLVNGQFEPTYVGTLGVDVCSYNINTNKGQFNVKLWDTAGDENFIGLGDGYYIQSHAAIAFYTKNSDHSKTDEMIKKFKSHNPGGKVVIVWSKQDDTDEKEYFDVMNCVSDGQQYLRRYQYTVDAISTMNGSNLQEPLKKVLRQLTGHYELDLN